jgi:hypothetical protein
MNPFVLEIVMDSGKVAQTIPPVDLGFGAQFERALDR